MKTKKRICTLCRDLQIEPAGIAEYKKLSVFHYRGEFECPAAAVYVMRDLNRRRSRFEDIAGVIVYTMPAPSVALRNIATGGVFCMGDRVATLEYINKNIRCISRVIIEPRRRGLGLAAELVRQTLPQAGVPVVEAMAVMGTVVGFFERAGMKAYYGKTPLRSVQLIEAFGAVGIEQDCLVDAASVQKRVEALPLQNRRFIEKQIAVFLGAYKKRKLMADGVERMRFVLGRLTERPVYYIWTRAWADGGGG